MKFDCNPEYRKVILVGVLLFFEALLANVCAVFSQGRWPTSIEVAGYLSAAALQLVTYFLGFLRREETAE